MARSFVLTAGMTCLMLGYSAFGLPKRSQADSATKACQLLHEAFPELVSFPGSERYEADIEHWAFTSSQNSTCSVEPQTEDDVSEILKIVGREDIMSPFAVKGGGHAFNPGHSSTPGVQISMSQFTGVEYDAERGTVTIGTGLTWDKVYSQLEPLGVMVVGGRIIGVGVAGLSLGGGYSWKTNQYGLTIDTIVSHNVVLPSGQQVVASNTSYPDLFFGLRGGLNNFGIATNITYEAHPQTLVYGGSIVYGPDAIDDLNKAISDFAKNNNDSKAQMIPTYLSTSGQFSTALLLFYDAPEDSSGIFDPFLAIPSISADVKSRTFVDFMTTSSPLNNGFERFGAVQHVIPATTYPKPLLDTMVQQVNAFSEKLQQRHSNDNGTMVLMAAEPFLDPNSHSRGGAYPHPPSRQITPAFPEFTYEIDPDWTAEEQSDFFDFATSLMKEFSNNIQAEAVALGVSSWDDILYPNYAMDGTPLNLMYGSNVQKLRDIAEKYDPRGVMKLTGGPHF